LGPCRILLQLTVGVARQGRVQDVDEIRNFAVRQPRRAKLPHRRHAGRVHHNERLGALPQHRAGPDEIRLADIIQTVRDTLRLKAAHEDLTTYNAAQKLLYTVVILAGLTDGHIQNFVPGVWPPTASTRLDKPPVPNSRRPDVLRANSEQSACQSQPKL